MYYVLNHKGGRGVSENGIFLLRSILNVIAKKRGRGGCQKPPKTRLRNTRKIPKVGMYSQLTDFNSRAEFLD